MVKKDSNTQHSFSTKLYEEKDSSLMWYFRIDVPPHIVNAVCKAKNKRVLCLFNGELKSQVPVLSSGEKKYYITINKEIRQKLKLKTGDMLTVTISMDESEYGIETPDFFNEFCEQDSEGSAHFHALSPGKQRTLLYLMNKPKSENKKIEKAIIVFDYLKSSSGKLDFRELNEYMKNNRFNKT
ncbi:MAG: DUF1905 domain-containing protein [Crocinitomicaceae bacterium]|nr:DUF1905 domain-containing protein [Crocinitomicaceae bacterium]MBK8925782.1 DUF1905 domain-containing protein [Crocinitomicaceae bacterium]